MPRPRDSYRKRVLDSEAKVPCSTYFQGAIDGTLQCAAPLVPTLVKSRWWQARFPDGRSEMTVVWTRATKCMDDVWFEPGGTIVHPDGIARGRPDVYHHSIELARADETRVLDVYHALAHHLHADDTAWHGPEFCKAYLDLVKRCGSNNLYDALKARFSLDKIKTRTWPTEAKAAAGDRAKAKVVVADLLDMRDELAADIATGEWT